MRIEAADSASAVGTSRVLVDDCDSDGEYGSGGGAGNMEAEMAAAQELAGDADGWNADGFCGMPDCLPDLLPGLCMTFTVGGKRKAVELERPDNSKAKQLAVDRDGQEEAEKAEEGDVDEDRPRGAAVGADEALTRLEAEVVAKGPKWRISRELTLAAPWDERWKAGKWVSNRRGQTAQVVAHRRNMTPAQRSRLEALPYGSERH